MSNAPLLILGLQRTSSAARYKVLVWVLTFFVYTSYHLSRKPITVVKNVLHSNCSADNSSVSSNTDDCTPSWAPFDNDSTYQAFFGALDVTYLAGYAVGMFISGHIAERMNLRYYLSGGMTLSAIMTMAFGFGHWWGIHSLPYYIIVQLICGLVQSTGWPGVVACMGNWFGKGRRGLIMGIWNAHTSLGNILGGLIASAFLTASWSSNGYWTYSFLVPGLIIFFMAVMVFLLLVPNPEDVGLPSADNRSDSHSDSEQEHTPLINDSDAMDKAQYGTTENQSASPQKSDEEAFSDNMTPVIQAPARHEQVHAVSFIGALKVPGVVEFSVCLFFAKLVSYTFLYWLPEYIKQEGIDGQVLSDPAKTAGDLATIMDAGGILGAIAAGYFADLTNSSAITCAVMLILSIPMMVLYRIYGALSYANAVGLLLATGFMVNGPYCLITTSVSADLGTHPSLATSAKALATVTAIIDGTGSLGAALGPGLTAIIESLGGSTTDSERMNIIFGMLIGSNVCALLLLSRLIYKEVQAIKAKRAQQSV